MIEKNKSLDALIVFQKNEITEYSIYSRLARYVKDQQNKKLLQSIANDELKHYQILKSHTQKKFKANYLKVIFFYWLARIFGLTFGLKLLERAEQNAQLAYQHVEILVPEISQVIEDEEAHEKELINLINEERLNYVGSMVLGLNDALVELTGTLAGLTFAFQNTKLIALSGFITGIAASLSMAVSDYLAKRAEGGEKNAFKSALYTGIAYVITVVLLVFPYFLVKSYLVCLALVLLLALLIILVFNFYLSVAKDYSFRKRFFEMAALSLGVAAITFLIGYLLRRLIGIEI